MPPLPPRLSAALADRYRLERELGQGGMATVYLADDRKHGRQVAIKVLKPELAAVIGAQRFLAEIETTAKLQHPHILPLFDSGEADGFLYYVMPYVDGETVRDRLEREAQLGVDDAVAIAADVADALDYAHREGVIHRDVKPANILLHDGRPLVADFGIALALSAAGGGRMTETGLSLGTPWYMSPEQATADRDLTNRSDIYALGAVLYEMLAGEPPHTGPTGQAVVAKILTEDAPPLTRSRKAVPPHVAGATEKALEKLPADRFPTAKAFAEALRNPAFRYRTGGASGPDRSRPGTGRLAALLGWGLAAGLAAVTLWTAATRAPRHPTSPTVAAEIAVLDQDYALVAILDDGTVFSGLGNEVRVRRPTDLEFTTLHTDSRRTDGLGVSPDGRWVVFSTFGDPGAGLYKIPATGGDVVTLLGGAFADNPVWWADGWIYFRGQGGVLRIREDGGAVDTLLATPAPGRPGDLIDGGRALLIASGRERSVRVLDLESRDVREVAPEGLVARWSPTGHVLYTHPSGALFARPFSESRREPTGPPRLVLEGVSTSAPFFDLSATGVLVYQAGPPVSRWGRSEFGWIAPDGGFERIPIETVDGHTDAELSPDGRRVAYIREGWLHVFDLDLGTDIRMVPADHDPVWSPDGDEIAYRQDRVGGIRAMAANGQGDDRAIADLRATSPTDWLPDGTLVLATFVGDILAVDATPESDPASRDLLVARWQERSPTVSPDGRWIAYWSDEDGVARGYVRRWPSLDGRTLVTGPDTVWDRPEAIHWAPDSRGLYYARADGVLVHASLEVGDDIRVTGRAEGAALGTAGIQDLDRRGGRLLVTRSTVGGDAPDALPEPNRMVLVTDWFAELARRLGSGS